MSTRRSWLAGLASQAGNVTVIAALVFPILIGIAGLAIEYGDGLMRRASQQHVADAAAYAGALAYAQNSSTADMQTAAQSIASLNGLPISAVAVSLIASPSGDGNQAVQATVQTSSPLVFSRVLAMGPTLVVGSSAAAELAPGASSCVFALSPSGSGISLSGGTTLSAPACGVASNATVSPDVAVPCGTSLTSLSVTYASSAAPSAPCSGLQGPGGGTAKLTKATTTDPLAGSAEVAGDTARLASVTAAAAPANPTVGAGSAIDFSYNQSGTQASARAAGCTATFGGNNTWILTCPGTLVRFSNITIGGGITLIFNTGGSAATNYEISGSITNGGTAMTFGPGTWKILGGVFNSGGSAMTFGGGALAVGRPAASCNGVAGYSICQTSSGAMTFGSMSSIALAGGVYVGGGSHLTLPPGGGATVAIGTAADGNSIDVGGGGSFTLGDDIGSTVSTLGTITTGGGSCLALGAASQHDVQGSIAAAGAVQLGSGTYTVTGYAGFGTNGGGNVTCNGTTIGVAGSGVTFVIGGSATPSSGSCQGLIFCVAAGYSSVSLTAPTSGARLLVVGPATPRGGALLTEGASTSTLSGTVYLPASAFTLGGGAGVGSGSGQCLTLIASQIALNGGTVLATDCLAGSGSGSSKHPALVK